MTNDKEQTAVEWFSQQVLDNWNDIDAGARDIIEFFNKAKEMEEEKHEKFNKFLNDEKQLGISDLKTIERIQWYYNTYFNETYGGKND
jgi:uncharacterized protein (UPF0305 family)